MNVKEKVSNLIANRKLLILLASGFAGISLIVLAAFLIDNAYTNQTMPNQTFAGIEIGGLSLADAETKIKERWENLKNEKVKLAHDNKTQEVNYEELGLKWGDLGKSLEKIDVYSNDKHFGQLLVEFFKVNNVPAYVSSNTVKLETAIYNRFDNLAPAHNAFFARTEDGSLIIKPAAIGSKLDTDMLYQQMLNTLMDTELNTITALAETSKPTIKEADLMAVQDRFIDLISTPIKLVADQKEWDFSLLDRVEAIRFEEKDNSDFGYKLALDPKLWDEFIDAELAPTLEKQAENVELKLVEDKVEFTGKGVDGSVIDRPALLAHADEILNNAELNRNFQVNLKTVKAETLIDEPLQKMGITDVVASGHTTFYGSPNNRRHNIDVGLNRFNGIIIQPGETFSFNDNLGPVEAYTGYLPELVIKPEGTIPEYGGGLCQVSTTLYRAVLNADLPITERKPHSYAVSYYAQQMGDGLDATIYPGASDLRFENTTSAPLVLQSYIEGYEAFFKLYGMPKGIEVSYDGPFISRRVGAPAPVYIPSPNLAPGTKKQVEKAHGGFDVTWYKTVKHPDGTVEKKEIFSRYRAIPARFLVGPDQVPDTAEQTSENVSIAPAAEFRS